MISFVDVTGFNKIFNISPNGELTLKDATYNDAMLAITATEEDEAICPIYKAGANYLWTRNRLIMSATIHPVQFDFISAQDYVTEAREEGMDQYTKFRLTQGDILNVFKNVENPENLVEEIMLKGCEFVDDSNTLRVIMTSMENAGSLMSFGIWNSDNFNKQADPGSLPDNETYVEISFQLAPVQEGGETVLYIDLKQRFLYTRDEKGFDHMQSLSTFVLDNFDKLNTGKQDKLTPGANITISDEGVISASVDGGNYIPYDTLEGKNYVAENKEITVTDTADANDETTLSGQGILVRNANNTAMSVMRRDSMGVAVANSDQMESAPEVQVQAALTADLTEGAALHIQGVMSESQFNYTADVLGSKWEVSAKDDTDNLKQGMLEAGYIRDLTNWANKGDFVFHIKDVNREKADSYYALRNDGKGDFRDFAYIATEDYVNEKCPDWNIAEFDTAYITTHNYVGIEAPSGYAFDKLYVLIHWFGSTAPVATNIFGGFYDGAVTDASKQILRSNGTNRMGAAYFTANVINLNDISAIAYGDAYMYNSSGSATTLNNPVNSYGIGRFSHSNDFTHFSIHNYPTTSISEAYCCIKYQLKKL